MLHHIAKINFSLLTLLMMREKSQVVFEGRDEQRKAAYYKHATTRQFEEYMRSQWCCDSLGKTTFLHLCVVQVVFYGRKTA